MKLGNNDIAISTNISGDEKRKLIAFLSERVLPRDKVLVKTELEKTAAVRKNLLLKNDADFPKLFSFYIVDIDMVNSIVVSLFTTL